MTFRRAFSLPGVILGVVVAGWWLLTASGAVPAYLFPTPEAVAATLFDHPGLYARNGWVTLQRALVGGTLGAAFGFAFGVAVDLIPWLRRALYPYLVTARVLPKLAVAPLLLIYFGTGWTTGLVFVVVVTVFPMTVTTVTGLDATPSRHCDLAASVRADWWTVFLRIRLPNALPDVFGGVKQAAVLSVVGAVVAEWVVSTRGLGALLLLALANVQPAEMVAALLVLFCEGFAVYALVVLLERALTWRAIEE